MNDPVGIAGWIIVFLVIAAGVLLCIVMEVKEELRKLTEKYQGQGKELVDAKEKFRTAEKQCNEIKALLEVEQKKSESLQNEILQTEKGLKAKLYDLGNELKEKTENFNTLYKKHNELERQHIALGEQCESLQIDVHDLEVKLEEAAEEKEKLEKDVIKLKEIRDSLQKELTETRMALAKKHEPLDQEGAKPQADEWVENKIKALSECVLGNYIITKGFRDCLNAMLSKDGIPLFISGAAGTGKSTLIEIFRAMYAQDEGVAVLAPTGVAADLIKGQTIHSFFKINPTKELVPGENYSGLVDGGPGIYILQNLKFVILDEFSMVRPDLLDAIDRALREGRGDERPFGGCKMIFVGDMGQLPPVIEEAEYEWFKEHYGHKRPTVFQAKVFKESGDPKICRLKDVFRQTDEKFIGILHRIRENQATGDDLKHLNQRLCLKENQKPECERTTLFATNELADTLNDRCLRALSGEENLCEWIVESKDDIWRKSLARKLKKSKDPNREKTDPYVLEEKLRLKVGARIMMRFNNRNLYQNGTTGTIEALHFMNEKKDAAENPEIEAISVNLKGKTVRIERAKVLYYARRKNKQTGRLENTHVGTIYQFPMKLAWGITIHKSQGMSLDEVYVEPSGVFANGQAYVALSRVRSLGGLNLLSEVFQKDIRIESRLLEWM